MNLCFYCMNPIDSPEAICPHCGHDNHNRDNGPGLLSGGTLAGKYAVGRLLGRGGFGATYMGFDTFLQRRVAIKEYFPTNLVMRDGNSSSLSVISGGAESFVKGREKALQESRMASSLGSIPGIVQTYDVFTANNTIYIVMEYVEGDTLTRYVEKQPQKLSLSRAMELLEQVVTALSTLHRRKVIHRDVKPDNIMIRNDPEQGVLLDFGAARADDGSTLGNSSAVVSPGYAPPEQYNSTSLDGRIDQYALAATMYFVLTGQRPPDVMMRVVDNGALKPMQEYNPAISPRVDEVIRKAMSIKADERYGTITEFWDALKAALSGRSKPVTAPVKKTEKKPRKAKWLPAALAAVVVLGVGLFAALGGFSCKHDWREATCTAPVTCALCGAVEGEALGHSWKEATCTAPATCAFCGAVEGEALGHSWTEATCAVPKTCTVCALTEGTAPGHVWEAADADTPRTCTVCKAEMPVVLLVAGEFHTVCINPDGTVSATGYNDFGQCNVEGWTDVVQVAAGTNHTVALKADGTVVALGQNQFGQCNVGDWTDVVRIYADTDHTLGIRSDGTVYATGYNKFGECDLSHWTDIVDVAGGFTHTVGLKKDGTVVAAGNNEYYQLNVEDWTDIVDVATGDHYTVGLKKDGTIVFTGESYYNQRDHVSGWTDIVAIDGKHQNIVGLKADGTLVFGGQGYFGEEENQHEWKDIIALAPGDFHMAALKSDGTVIAYGENRYGQLNVEDWKLETAAITQKPVQAESDIVPLENANVGDYVIYGHYERDGEENLEWLVLDKKDGKLLLLSRYALAAEPFNTEYTDVTWQTSTLRNWINHDLMVDIIHDEDMRWIVMENAEAHDNAVYGTDAGNDASNHLFLLSAEEVQRYLPTEESRMCKPSPYSGKDIWTDDKGCCYWWLRTPGYTQSYAVFVNGDGVIEDYGGIVQGTSVAVRPAMWISLNPVEAEVAFDEQPKPETLNFDDIFFGQLDQFEVEQPVPELPTSTLNLSRPQPSMAVESRFVHIVGLKTDGTVVATGNNDNGQCDVSEWTDVVQVSAAWHTVGLKSDGTVLAVGSNENGQCEVSGWTDIVQVAAGYKHTVGLKSDGTVVATKIIDGGDKYQDNYGQSDVSDWTGIVQIATGSNYTLGLKADGTVLAVGRNDNKQCEVKDWTDIVQIFGGSNHTLGVKADGTVVAVGNNESGQCNVAGWTDIVQVTAGFQHTVGLKSDGTVVATGKNEYGECDLSGWKDIIYITAGQNYTAGLKSDGTVVAVGWNMNGQTSANDWMLLSGAPIDQKPDPVPSTPKPVDTSILNRPRPSMALDYRYVHIVGLKTDGTVVAAGNDRYGQCAVSNWTDMVQVSAAWHTVGLKSDGTVKAVGLNENGQCDVSGWTDIVQVAAGYKHTVGLKSDGTVVATKIIDGGDEYEDNYGQSDVSDWTDIVQIATGATYTLGLKADGTVVAAGRNDNKQCNVKGWTDIVQISGGSLHTVGVKSNGTVVATGNSEYGRCNVKGWKNIVQAAAGLDHTVGLKADGTVVAVGGNDHGQCDVSGWTDIVYITAGQYYTAGLKADGTVVTAGWDLSGNVSPSEWMLLTEEPVAMEPIP